MPNNVRYTAPPLSTPKTVVAVFGTITGAQLTVVFDDGTVLDRTSEVLNDWLELRPVPFSARAAELDTYLYYDTEAPPSAGLP